MKREIEKLLKENSGLLSRMKERDGNEELNKICLEIFTCYIAFSYLSNRFK